MTQVQRLTADLARRSGSLEVRLEVLRLKTPQSLATTSSPVYIVNRYTLTKGNSEKDRGKVCVVCCQRLNKLNTNVSGILSDYKMHPRPNECKTITSVRPHMKHSRDPDMASFGIPKTSYSRDAKFGLS